MGRTSQTSSSVSSYSLLSKRKGNRSRYSDFRMTLKNGFGVFVICFISQSMKRSKDGLFVFPPKKVRLTNQNPRAFVFVRQTYQIALFLLVCCFWDCFVRAFLFQGHTKMALYVPQLFLAGIVTGDAPVRSLLANFFHVLSNSPWSLSIVTTF